MCHHYKGVSNSLTGVSKNHTLHGCKENDKQLISKQIKVWHGICSTIIENEWITLYHGVMFLILIVKRELRCETRLPYTKRQRVITIKTQ